MPQRNRGGTLADLLYKAIRTPSAVRSSPSHLRPLFTSAPVTKPVHPLPSSFVSHRPHGPSHRQSQYELQGSALGPSGHRRAFSTTPSHHKKRDKKLFVKSQPDELVPDNKAEAKRQQEIDPYDYSELQKGIDKALDSFKNALSKTRNAGRVTVEMIEALPLELKEGKGATEGGSPPAGGAEKHKMKLGDIATVVARGGRTVQVIATEEGHIKPLAAAIQASSHSLTPEVPNTPNTPHQASSSPNPLTIIIPIPPATTETRQQAAEQAKKSLERAMLDIRNARGDAQKSFRKMELDRLVVRDELRKAHKGMEEVVKKGEAEAKKLHDNAVKALER